MRRAESQDEICSLPFFPMPTEEMFHDAGDAVYVVSLPIELPIFRATTSVITFKIPVIRFRTSRTPNGDSCINDPTGDNSSPGDTIDGVHLGQLLDLCS